MLPKEWRSEIRYFTEDEFADKVTVEDKVIEVSSDKISQLYNEERFSPVDGGIIEVCDKLAAYLEAYLSIKHGVSSDSLKEGHASIYSKFRKSKINGLELGALFDYFKL